MPPRERGRSFHETDRGDEGVEDARILASARLLAEGLVKCVRVATDKIARIPDPDPTEIARERRADVGNHFQLDRGIWVGGFRSSRGSHFAICAGDRWPAISPCSFVPAFRCAHLLLIRPARFVGHDRKESDPKRRCQRRFSCTGFLWRNCRRQARKNETLAIARPCMPRALVCGQSARPCLDLSSFTR